MRCLEPFVNAAFFVLASVSQDARPSGHQSSKFDSMSRFVSIRSGIAPEPLRGPTEAISADFVSVVSLCLDRDAAETKRDVETQGGPQAARGPKSNRIETIETFRRGAGLWGSAPGPKSNRIETIETSRRPAAPRLEGGESIRVETIETSRRIGGKSYLGR